jgi:hypothetical protein
LATYAEKMNDGQVESGSESDIFEEVCGVLDDLILMNDTSKLSDSDEVSRLFTGSRVRFNATFYLNRILQYSNASPSCFVVALGYLGRFKRRYPSVLLTSRTIQRLLLVAVMTATKYLEDSTLGNDDW